MPTRKIPFTFHLDEDVLEKIKILADLDNRSTSNMLEYLCKEQIRKYENEHGTIPIDIY